MALTASVVLAGERPNVIVILTDDLGYGDLGCFGATDVSTPNIDEMAKEGLKLTSFYVSPVCSPTRASLMTGCYAQRVGIGGVLFERSRSALHPDEETLPELLRAQGYATALIGKWHLGYRDGQRPPSHGFDYWYGTVASNNTKFTTARKVFSDDCVFRDGITLETVEQSETVPCSLMRGGEVIEVPADQAQFTRRYTEETIRFITEERDEPFFVYLAHNMPHIPLHASDAFLGKSKRGLYGDVIEELDWGIGEIFRALTEHGLEEKTLVVLTSDNGTKLEAGGSAGPFKGAKGSSFEGGIRVPCLVRWPGKIESGRVSDAPVAIMDLLPTIVGLAGGEIPSDRIIDGRDLWPLFSGEENASPHEAVYFLKGRSVKGIRVGNWKLITEDEPEEKDEKKESLLTKEERKLSRQERLALLRERRGDAEKEEGPVTALYDVSNDLGEEKNQIEKEPEVAEKLRSMIETFDREIRKNERPAERVDAVEADERGR
ncbi:MAG: sulfatase [Verrucomicrobiota bacterium]